jgi:hypothetical protein
LLKAGKSLTDLKNSTHRYRVRSRFLLPKFGSTKNPFTAPVPVEVIQAAAEGSPAVARYQKSPAELSAARLKDTAKLPETAPAESSPAAISEEPKLRAAPKTGWFDRIRQGAQMLNPFRLWPKRNPVARPVTSRPGRSPVQAELSLDNIKVMRNDLNDADVEIVPARPPSKARPETGRSKSRNAPEMTATLVETQPG